VAPSPEAKGGTGKLNRASTRANRKPKMNLEIVRHFITTLLPDFKRSLAAFICTAAVCIHPVLGNARTLQTALPEPGASQTVSLYFENDLFGNTDQHYTNAVKLTWQSKDLKEYRDDIRIPEWAFPIIDQAPLVNDPEALHNIGLSFGQNIYTPSDIETTELLEEDRPYAGFLYFSLALHSKNETVLDTLESSFGIVGPSALSELSQNTVHEVRGLSTAKGWNNQLHDEPGLLLTWKRSLRILRRDLGFGLAWDLIPHMGVTLGNVATYANAGGEIRIGYRLPYDFGTSLIRPGGSVSAPSSKRDRRLRHGIGVHLFAGTDGRAVLHNIFLDGNTWQDSHSVDKKHFVADISLGAALTYKGLSLSYSHVYRTREFKGQEKGQTFGSLNLGWTF
jgi:hypothetical protein